MRITNKLMTGLALAAAIFAAPVSAGATTIDWAFWTATTTGYPAGGSALGALTFNQVLYTGELLSVQANYPSWTPVGTFSGGTISNAPPQSGGIVQLQGGANPPTVDTITFLTPVLNPVMAIWSLGQNGVPTTFDFDHTFTIQSGGPSFEYNGNPITSAGLIVNGIEGNGTIQFNGLISSISWTNPTFEYWYGFTVGVPLGPDGGPATTPLPAALPLFASGLGALGFLGWRRKRKAKQA